jgi:hypothetical protein
MQHLQSRKVRAVVDEQSVDGILEPFSVCVQALVLVHMSPCRHRLSVCTTALGKRAPVAAVDDGKVATLHKFMSHLSLFVRVWKPGVGTGYASINRINRRSYAWKRWRWAE